VQLGLLPRFEVRFTSETHAGQIYLPRVNTLLLIGVMFLVLMFRTSGNLGSAYGIAVSTTMVADGIMGFVVIWKLWNWRAATAAALVIPLVTVDLIFFAANLLKLLEGAWVPLLFGLAMVITLIRPRVGFIAFAWALAASSARVYEGLHYPSDILAGAGLGVTVVCILQHQAILRFCFPVLQWADRRAGIFYAGAFIASYSVAQDFSDIRDIGRALAAMFLHF